MQYFKESFIAIIIVIITMMMMMMMMMMMGSQAELNQAVWLKALFFLHFRELLNDFSNVLKFKN